MTAADKTGGSDVGASEIAAWPGRLVGMVLGPPSEKCGPANGRLRYRACKKCASSVGLVNVLANAGLTTIKGYLGVVGRSTALVADAIHSAADFIAAVLLLLGLKMAAKPADEEYPYGYGKVEFLVAVAIYTSLMIAGIVILIDAVSSIIHFENVKPSPIAIWGAVISIIVNEMMYRQSICAGSQVNSPSMIANAWEKRTDVLASIAVLVGIVGANLGFHFLDPLMAILVAFYIMKFSVEMIFIAFNGLLDQALVPEVVQGIRDNATAIEGVRGIAQIRSREIGQNVWIDLEVIVDGNFEISRANRIKNEVRQAVLSGIDRPAHVVVYLKSVSD